ncbi:HNH endonuclease [Antrihabitans stalactiti]|uniref:HNH endonuclease n=1 Tax=Antrihabitans stalactiti TaxID=2584121 RepID=A0A848KDL0_9NOCA|nr:HNH endonuclease [Antrihabitans stalactiti]NMN94250.1 HNH endonuclease [Antrihabitans stalactiti]
MFDSRILELATKVAGLDDDAHVDRIAALEELKSACAAVQATAALQLDTARRVERAERGVPKRLQGRGIGTEVALARRESPNKGDRLLGFARAMAEMPHTHALLAAGKLNEWRATLLVQETACLTKEDRATVDEQLCADPTVLDGLGDRAVAAKAREHAARLDVEALVRRGQRAVGDRHVSVRPAADSMVRLSALVPVVAGIGAYAALRRDADALVGTGAAGERSRSQVMADLLVERLTGTGTTAAQPVSVNVVISDEALFGDAEAPAHVDGYGDLPAAIARTWISEAVEGDVAELRRVYAHPGSGALVNLESVARCFPKGLARFINLRDKVCRTPWCDAPIRHSDHIEPVENGGATTASNGAGLCEACNYAKQGLGWHTEPLPGLALHRISVITPDGHTYLSTAPPLPRPATTYARMVQALRDVTRAA